MKKRLLVGVAVAAIVAAPATAAEIRVKRMQKPAPAAKPIPIVTGWTGFYVGGNLGYGKHHEQSPVLLGGNNVVSGFLLNPGPFFPGATPLPPAIFDSKGIVGGPQVGYNWQWGPAWVVGLETDYNWSRIRGDTQVGNTLVPAIPLQQSVTFQEKIPWFGTVRARLGWLATPTLLLYGTGGIAYGRVNQSISQVFTASGVAPGTPLTITSTIDFSGFRCFIGSPCMVGTTSRTETGWTAGAGAEFAVAPFLTVKAEYLCVRLDGGTSLLLVAPPAPAPFVNPVSWTATFSRTDFHAIRFGANYHFNGPLY